MREWVCLNGELLPAEEARISVFDSGFLQGVGLFETMRGYQGRVFRLEAHLRRLIRSARTMGWTVLPEEELLRDHVERALGASESDDARVRLTVTTGSLRASEDVPPQLTVVASASPGAAYPEVCYSKGVTVTVANSRQPSLDMTCGHKTTSYFSRLGALRQTHQQGAFECLWFTYDRRLAEGAISNVFLVRKDELLTPPLDTPVLPGITRAVVIEQAAQLGVPVRETALSIDDLLSADEVILTNSLMELVPAVRIEREPVGLEKPGDVFLQLLQAYRQAVAQECVDEG